MVNDDTRFGDVLKGRIDTAAEYKQQPLEEYSGNPFIEALPNIFTEVDVAGQFTVDPLCKYIGASLQKNIRYHYIRRLKTFLLPFEIHIRLERKLSSILRRGYIARNPMTKAYLERLRYLRGEQEPKDEGNLNELCVIAENLRSTAEGFSITGISGMGKSISIERLLMMYPQVIVHNEYDGRPFTVTQIVWLKLDTPHDGSIKTLCKSFFKALDDVLGTNYISKFGANSRSTATMMIHMTQLASLYAIGVIVIDEIQHLANSKSNPEEILNFLVTLVNTIGVPVITIGTPSAERIFRHNFRQARRAGSVGSVIWDRMKKDDEWQYFIEAMWEFQWLEEHTDLTDELNDALYFHSQGITALAVILFMLAQERGLDQGCTQVTSALFDDVAENDLSLMQNMIQALRNNDITEIAKYDDIMNSLDDILLNRRLSDYRYEKVNEFCQSIISVNTFEEDGILEIIVAEIIELNMLDHMKSQEIENAVKMAMEYSEDTGEIKRRAIRQLLEMSGVDKKAKKSKKRTKTDGILMTICNNARKSGRSSYEALKDNAIIKSPFDDFFASPS